jgi:hypothetical protein
MEGRGLCLYGLCHAHRLLILTEDQLSVVRAESLYGT